MTTSGGGSAGRLAEMQCGPGVASTAESKPPLVAGTCLPEAGGEISWRARVERAPASTTR